jgi:hypothetical protein
MSLISWVRRFLGMPPPAPPASLDEQSGILGDILRFGEAAGGDAAAAEQEQTIADKPQPPA